MGAVLSQLDEEGVEHPICYASLSCNPVEQNYSSFDDEFLLVVWATNHFRAYLFGNSFTLVTDHEPLRWLMTTEKLTGEMARWSLLLQEYDFTVQHRAGVDNTNAECLTRFPLMSEENAPILNWSRGEIPTYQTAMATGAAVPSREETNIWGGKEVLHFIQTHQHGKGLSAQERDRVYKRSRGYRWLGNSLFKLMEGGALRAISHQPTAISHPKGYSWHWRPIGEWGISVCNE